MQPTNIAVLSESTGLLVIQAVEVEWVFTGEGRVRAEVCLCGVGIVEGLKREVGLVCERAEEAVDDGVAAEEWTEGRGRGSASDDVREGEGEGDPRYLSRSVVLSIDAGSGECESRDYDVSEHLDGCWVVYVRVVRLSDARQV